MAPFSDEVYFAWGCFGFLRSRVIKNRRRREAIEERDDEELPERAGL
jgi:hypothetical protein